MALALIIQALEILIVGHAPILAMLLEMVEVSVGPAKNCLDSIMQAAQAH